MSSIQNSSFTNSPLIPSVINADVENPPFMVLDVNGDPPNGPRPEFDYVFVAYIVMKIALTVIVLASLVMFLPYALMGVCAILLCGSGLLDVNLFNLGFHAWVHWISSRDFFCACTMPDASTTWATPLGDQQREFLQIVSGQITEDTYELPLHEGDVADNVPRRAAFNTFFTENVGNVHVCSDKLVPFWELMSSYRNQRIDCVSSYLRDFHGEDLQEHEELKQDLIRKLNTIYYSQAIPGREGFSSRKVCQYVTILFNIFAKYKQIIEYFPTEEQQAVRDLYKEHFVETMTRLEGTLNDGCPFNQISYLPTLLTETLLLNANMIPEDRDPIDYHFALLFFKYERYLIDNGVRRHQFDGEQVELQYAVLQRLGLVQDGFNSHLFNQNSSTVDLVEEDFLRDFKPLEFLMGNLTEPTSEVRLTASFHTIIWQWYTVMQGFDLDDEADKALLLNVEQSSEFVPCFNERAILYFLKRNQLVGV
jgi:hypothetical protein